MPKRPPGGAQRFRLIVAGQTAGLIVSVSGGDPFAEVVREVAGTGGYVGKHLGPARFRPIVITVGADLHAVVRQWLKDVLANAATPVDGAITEHDATGKEVSRLVWTGGVVAEVSFPALDGASKERAVVMVTIEVASAKRIKPPPGPAPAAGPPSKTVLVSNFRFKLTDLDTTKVQSVSPIVVRRTPAGLDVDEFSIHINRVATAPFVAWAEDFIVAGHSSQTDERAGSIELLTPNLADVVLRIELFQVGIFEMAPEKASLYCERAAIADG